MFLLIYSLFHVTGAYPDFNKNLEIYEVDKKLKLNIIGFDHKLDKNEGRSYLQRIIQIICGIIKSEKQKILKPN